MLMIKDAKCEGLRRQGALNPRPDGVTDPLFRTHEFFDANDLVQVKYEMLRRVQIDDSSVTAAAAAFGFSRFAFYQAQAIYKHHGLPGLIRRRPGPQHPHKLADPIVDFVRQRQISNPQLRSAALATLVREAFGLIVHPRSIERALARHQKKVPRRSMQPKMGSRGAAPNRGRLGMRISASRFSSQEAAAVPLAAADARW